MGDALFGPDGTQASPPPPTYPDALSGTAMESVRAPSSVQPVRARPPSPVKPPRSGNRMRQAVTDNARRPAAAARTAAVPAAYEPPRRVAPAGRMTAGPSRRTGSAVIGWLVILLILGSVAFNVLHGLLRDLGIVR
jgi:hypothetical protein